MDNFDETKCTVKSRSAEFYLYNGDKIIYSVKFNILAPLNNGFTRNFSGLYDGRRYRSTKLKESGLFTDLERVVWVNDKLLCIKVDQVNPCGFFIERVKPVFL